MSQRFCVEHNLTPIEGAALPTPTGFVGQSAFCYGAHTLRVRITDSLGRERTTEDTFYAMDLTGPPVLLGRPWRKKQGIVADAATDRWRYGLTANSLSILSPEDFASELQKQTQVFAVLISGTDQEATGKLGRNELPAELAEFNSVFIYEDIANLPNPPKAEHAIPIEDSKKPSYWPLYNISSTELATL